MAGREYTFQLDYIHPISKSHEIEFGGKFINRQREIDYSNTQEIFFVDESEEEILIQLVLTQIFLTMINQFGQDTCLQVWSFLRIFL